MSNSSNPLDAEDTIGVVLTYDELRLLVTSLKSDGDHQTSTLRDPLLARLSARTRSGLPLSSMSASARPVES